MTVNLASMLDEFKPDINPKFFICNMCRSDSNTTLAHTKHSHSKRVTDFTLCHKCYSEIIHAEVLLHQYAKKNTAWAHEVERQIKRDLKEAADNDAA